MTFTMTATGRERIDVAACLAGVDLADVATRLLGPAPGRRGDRSDRLWWRCPFHEDGNPSFCIRPEDRQWRCFGCGEYGDAIDLVRRLDPAMTFPEAIRFLTGDAPAPLGRPFAPIVPRPPRQKPKPLDPDWQAHAASVVAEASQRLWTPEGAEALAYLKGRGLSGETIRSARLGVVTRWNRDLPAGIVIPWGEGPDLSLVKIRRPEGSKQKYLYLKGSRVGGLYPGPHVIRPGKPLIIVEGEFDALLLGQELGELAAVVTLGSASGRSKPAILGKMLDAWPRVVATDADPAGERAASEWPASFRRVRPPEPDKDWTDALQSRVNLRRWWTDALAGIDNPIKHTPDELLSWRWGDNPEQPGIVINRPDLGAMVQAFKDADPTDAYAIEERRAIIEADRSAERHDIEQCSEPHT